jgi:peptidoglycan/LPS O-acetylase OafA/YrhL
MAAVPSDSHSGLCRASIALRFNGINRNGIWLASKPSRYGFIDAIRGLAACCVMLQHSLCQSGLLGGRPPEKLTGFVPTWLELGETGVVAFFLVSGFVIPLSLEKTAQLRLLWIHRVLRIYPLYMTIFALTFLAMAGGDIHTLDAFILNFVSHVLFIQEYTNQEGFVGGAWTLSLEMVWYISISFALILSYPALHISTCRWVGYRCSCAASSGWFVTVGNRGTSLDAILPLCQRCWPPLLLSSVRRPSAVPGGKSDGQSSDGY